MSLQQISQDTYSSKTSLETWPKELNSPEETKANIKLYKDVSVCDLSDVFKNTEQ